MDLQRVVTLEALNPIALKSYNNCTSYQYEYAAKFDEFESLTDFLRYNSKKNKKVTSGRKDEQHAKQNDPPPTKTPFCKRYKLMISNIYMVILIV